MYLEEVFNTAFKALTSNKLRSFLTMLGVIIGVFSVVSLVSLGTGLQNYITDEFNELGTNLIFISPGKVSTSSFGDDPAKLLSKNKLDEQHLDLINTYAAENITAVSPYVIVGENIDYKTKTYYAEITGLSAEGQTMISYQINEGRFFTKAEETGKAKVAVIGADVDKELFGAKSPLGAKVRIGDNLYEITGVFKEKGSNYDDQILVPYTSAMESFKIELFSSVIAQVASADKVDIAITQTEQALLRDLDPDDFTVLSQGDFLESIQSILGMLTLALSAIAAISLLVGGIGIMNIMLVSVTERIKEIGLRKALGATPKNIALQFLTESILLSVTGGIIGLVLGVLLTQLVQSFVRAEIPFYAIALAMGFSILVGVVFGTYPAINAGKKDPIEALRYE